MVKTKSIESTKKERIQNSMWDVFADFDPNITKRKCLDNVFQM
jgi:hypothetical protein